jgi:hypothetical protein
MLIMIMGCIGLALNIISVIFLHGKTYGIYPFKKTKLIALRTR